MAGSARHQAEQNTTEHHHYQRNVDRAIHCSGPLEMDTSTIDLYDNRYPALCPVWEVRMSSGQRLLVHFLSSSSPTSFCRICTILTPVTLVYTCIVASRGDVRLLTCRALYTALCSTRQLQPAPTSPEHRPFRHCGRQKTGFFSLRWPVPEHLPPITDAESTPPALGKHPPLVQARPPPCLVSLSSVSPSLLESLVSGPQVRSWILPPGEFPKNRFLFSSFYFFSPIFLCSGNIALLVYSK